jgi:hypothetical protein
VDDEVGKSGSVSFQVIADGVLLFDSGTMNGSSATKTVNVSVAGKKELKLLVFGGNDGVNYDHADWANARLLSSTTTPDPAVPATSTTVYASDLQFVSSTNAWGAVEKDRSNGELGSADGKTLTLAGTTYAKGLGVHAASEVVLNVPTGFKRFKSDIGIDDEVGSLGSVIFKVYAGTKVLYTSSKLTGASATQSINIDVTGYTQLRLVADGTGDGINSDHADWAGARFEQA